MSQVYHLPKLVHSEIENLLDFCKSKPYDCLYDLQSDITNFLEGLDLSITQGYIELKD